jgi:hypothetical protein
MLYSANTKHSVNASYVVRALKYNTVSGIKVQKLGITVTLEKTTNKKMPKKNFTKARKKLLLIDNKPYVIIYYLKLKSMEIIKY